MSRKGIQVPSGLVNISRLRFMTNATRKKSINITNPRKITAVINGEVKFQREK